MPKLHLSASPPECSAAPAGARDRARSRRPARPGRAVATVLVAGLLLFGAAAAEAQTVDTTDATLSALSVSGATLSPAFDAATTTYRAVVVNAVSQGTITVTTSESTATLEYLDGSDNTLTDADTMTASFQRNLSVGTNIVKVKVTAPDTATTQTYTVNILRVAVPVACSPASMTNRIWTGNLTVGLGGDYILDGETIGQTVGFSGSHGALDNINFSYKGTAYTISSVTVVAANWVYLTLESTTTLGTDANDLMFHMGTVQLALADASYNSSRNAYVWRAGSYAPAWANGDAACLALTEVVAPTVTGVALTSAPGSDSTYAIDDAVTATMTFDAAVDIGGTPQLELDFNGTAKAAACATGTNTTTMACSYTVAVGDSAPNGIAIAANKLTGGTITTTSLYFSHTTINADLDHVAVVIDAGHTVDGIRPTLVTTGSEAPTTSTDGTTVILTFSEDISAADRTKITIQANGATAATSAASKTGTTVELTLTTALTATDTTLTVALAADAVADAAANGILAVAATAVTNAVGTTTAPTVSGVALTSTPGADNTYAIGDAVAATVTFSAAVDITGSPQLELDFAGTAKAAACATATNTTTMACSYTVVENDTAPNGVRIAANKLTGGTIYATGGTTVSAVLTHSAVAIDAGHTVDGIRPTLVTAAPDAPTTSADGETVLLVFSEAIGAVSHSDITIQANSVTVSTTMASVAGTKVELTLTTALTAAATNITVELSADAVADAVGNGNLVVAATPVTNAVGTTGSNTDPEFSSTTATRSVPENSGGGTNVGNPVTATDTGDTLTYTLEGDDADSFTIVSTSGQIRTRSDVTYTRSTYEVIVRATDSLGNSDTIAVTITLTASPPTGGGGSGGGGGGGSQRETAPDAPRNLTATAGDQAVQLAWSKPVNDGGTPIVRYEYRQQAGDGLMGAWQILAGDPPPTDYTVTGLTNGVSYTFEVRAVNRREASPPSEAARATPEPERAALVVAIVGVPEVALAGASYELTAQSDAEAALGYAWRVAYGEGGSVEPTDTQTVVWTAPSGVTVAWIRVDVTREEDGATAGQSAYVRVEVPDQTRLTLRAAPAPAEGGAPVTVTATLDAPAPADGTTVTLTTGGTATRDTDYTLSSTTITLAAGETAGTVTLTVIDDAEADAGETIVLNAASTSPALTAAPLTLTIEDNDVTPVPALPLLGQLLLALGLMGAGARRLSRRPRVPPAA